MIDRTLLDELRVNYTQEPLELRLRNREKLLYQIGEYLHRTGVTYDTYRQGFREWATNNREELQAYLDVPNEELRPVFEYIKAHCAELDAIEQIYYLDFLRINGFNSHLSRFYEDFYADFFVEQFIFDALLFYALERRKLELMVSLPR